MCLKKYELDPGRFCSVPGLAWQIAFKKIDLLTDINMLLLVEKVIREGISHALH